jgi:hypothetical protein
MFTLRLSCVLLCVTSLFPSSGVSQITGRVVDRSGRALPNAVVVSRTGNGFLATRTDVSGRFAYPGRPHRLGHTIEASSAGFQGTVLRLQGDETDVVLTLLPGGAPGPGWTLGLPISPRMIVTDAAGTTVSPASLTAGREYRLVVTMRATHCTQASDAVVEEQNGEWIVAVAAFTRSGDCAAAEEEISIPHRFTEAGRFWIRIVGRNADSLLETTVVSN